MKRLHRVSFALLSVVACSGSQAHPELALPAPPLAVARQEAPPAPEPVVAWSVEPHVAVRSAVAADFFEGTLAALSGSGTLAVYRRAEDAVVLTVRLARRADGGEVVCGRHECVVRVVDEASYQRSAYFVDLATGAARGTDENMGYRVGEDGEIEATGALGEEGDGYAPSSLVTAVDGGYDVESAGQVLSIRGITGGGEHAIHDLTLHPRGRGVLIHQRAGVVYVRASGAREVACLDERPAAFTPDGARVAQGDDGLCDPETDAGHPATPEPGYGSGYGSGYAATAEEPPDYQDVCSPTDPEVCVRLPYDEGATASLVVRGRPRRLAGTAGFVEARFVPDGTAFVLFGDGIRGFELPRGRERRAWRRDDVELVEVLADGSLVVLTDDGTALLAADGTETAIAPASVRTEGITQHDDGGIYLCTAAGLSVREPGATAFRMLTSVPCGRVATLGSGVAVTSGVGGGERTVISLADGRVIGTYGVPWIDAAPLDAEVFSRCTEEGAPLEVLEVATLERRTLGPCTRDGVYSADGSILAARVGAGVELTRTADGAVLELRVIRAGGGPVLVALAPDGAFWVARTEDAALVDLVRRQDGAIVEALRGSSARALSRHHRPTLLADFFEGRPLPRAGE